VIVMADLADDPAQSFFAADPGLPHARSASSGVTGLNRRNTVRLVALLGTDRVAAIIAMLMIWWTRSRPTFAMA